MNRAQYIVVEIVCRVRCREVRGVKLSISQQGPNSVEFLGGSGALAPSILDEDLQSWCILQKEHFSYFVVRQQVAESLW